MEGYWVGTGLVLGWYWVRTGEVLGRYWRKGKCKFFLKYSYFLEEIGLEYLIYIVR